MATDLVTFNIRCEKSQYELKIPTPIDFTGFIDELKNKLTANITDELVVLCPMPDGKMIEIKSDDDIDFLKKTKLCYNAVSKEIYCSVELVVTIICKQFPDDPKFQIKMLSNKVDQLALQFVELSQSLNTKIEGSSSLIIENIRTIMADYSQNEENLTKSNSLDESNSPNILNFEPKNNQIPNKIKKRKEKLPTSSSITLPSNDNVPKLPENLNQQNKSVINNKAKDIDELLEILAKEGFTNTIQNIIVLKRFENDCEKAINYLKTGA